MYCDVMIKFYEWVQCSYLKCDDDFTNLKWDHDHKGIREVIQRFVEII